MSDEIHLTLSRADAELAQKEIARNLTAIRRGYGEAITAVWLTPLGTALDAALAEGPSSLQKMQKTQAAPAEGPERAATGETLVRCGRCGVPFSPHPDPARFDHDFCEACLPEAVKHWGVMQTPPERRAAGEGTGA